MSVSIRITAVLIAAITLALAAVGAQADVFLDFESGLGHNGQAIGGTPGIVFGTTSGSSMYYADINSGWYGVTSDNGKVYDDGEYFVSGNVAAYIANPSDRAKISFAYGTATYFTVGYSSRFGFTLEAYNSSDQLLNYVTGPANTKSQGGTGLSYLTVNSANTAYVILHDQGGFWMVDNIETDAPTVPEPGSCAALFTGVAFVAFRRKFRA
jgi:hypothetical protein